jgi:hypothetical protein
MRRDTTARIALLLLVSSLLLPVAPALEAAVQALTGDAHACCRRAGAACCHRARRDPAAPAWTASRECGTQCAQAPGVTVSALAFGASPAVSVPHIESSPGVPANVNRRSSSYSAYLYQRPPPLS